MCYLNSQTGAHHVKLVHKLFMQRPHVLRDKLLMHCQSKFKNVCLRKNRIKDNVTEQKFCFVYKSKCVDSRRCFCNMPA